jgi:hypothetical protein
VHAIAAKAERQKHFGEAIAMALFISHRQMRTFDTFVKDPQRSI